MVLTRRTVTGNPPPVKKTSSMLLVVPMAEGIITSDIGRVRLEIFCPDSQATVTLNLKNADNKIEDATLVNLSLEWGYLQTIMTNKLTVLLTNRLGGARFSVEREANDNTRATELTLH